MIQNHGVLVGEFMSLLLFSTTSSCILGKQHSITRRLWDFCLLHSYKTQSSHQAPPNSQAHPQLLLPVFLFLRLKRPADRTGFQSFHKEHVLTQVSHNHNVLHSSGSSSKTKLWRQLPKKGLIWTFAIYNILQSILHPTFDLLKFVMCCASTSLCSVSRAFRASKAAKQHRTGAPKPPAVGLAVDLRAASQGRQPCGRWLICSELQGQTCWPKSYLLVHSVFIVQTKNRATTPVSLLYNLWWSLGTNWDLAPLQRNSRFQNFSLWRSHVVFAFLVPQIHGNEDCQKQEKRYENIEKTL